MAKQLQTGKLAARTLERLLGRYAARSDPAVLIGPAVGVDAAALAVKDSILIVASDPVTYATEQLGYFAVHVNANDIFVCGGEPRWFLADILLPPGKARLAEKVFRQIHHACRELGVSLIGGHTELTPDLPRPMVAGFMIGQCVVGPPLAASGVRAGDEIVLTKGVAIEGTAIIARERRGQLVEALGRSMVRRARAMLDSPGISVGPEARIAIRHGVHAMHDPTEGGLLNGLWEMAAAAGLAIDVDVQRVAVYPETAAVCAHLGLDALGLLASGALLLACPRRSAEPLLDELAEEGIAACRIGHARRGPPAVHLSGGRTVTSAVTDEILKTFDES